MPRLIISERGKEGERVHECLEPRITIGRNDDNIIRLLSPGISRHHIEVVAQGDRFLLVDLGSGNGTLLNGRKIASKEKHLLRHSDMITIDTYDLRFTTTAHAEAALVEEEVTESDVLEVKLLKTVLAALDRETVPSLEVLNGSEEGKRIHLTDDIQELIIGRDPECSFPIHEHVVSRQHAKVAKRWGGIIVRDLDSKNGTFLNNRRIVEEYLHDGDRIAFGTIVLMFRNPQEINLAQLEAEPLKRMPLQVRPEEIPLVETTANPLEEEAEEKLEVEEEPSDAVSDWEKVERNVGPQEYPEPSPLPKTFGSMTPTEIGMIGLGSLVLVFAVITLINLLMS